VTTAYPVVTQAFVACWNSKESSCSAFNTVALQADIAPTDLKGWFCGEASEADVGGQANYDTAADIFGCAITDVSDVTFFTGAIHAGVVGEECFGFTNGMITEGMLDANVQELVVDVCSAL